MVRLDRIYTGGGDKGETSLGGGARVAKHGLRITAMGEVDEANAAIGLARVVLGTPGDGDVSAGAILARIQNDLFDLGADLARPGADASEGRLRIAASQVARLEAEIDEVNAGLEALDSFVLPGGAEAAARLHLARTITRRAERAVVALAASEEVNGEVPVYLNRLSDLLFVCWRAGRTMVARTISCGSRARLPNKTKE
jgi:cob(I)alamin adenosyltransferase